MILQDLQTLDLRPFQHSGANITGIRMLDPDNPFVRTFVENRLEDFQIAQVEKLRTEDALMFDAVALFSQAYKDLNYEYEFAGKSLPEKYNIPQSWPYGLSLRNYMLYVSILNVCSRVFIIFFAVKVEKCLCLSRFVLFFLLTIYRCNKKIKKTLLMH